MARKARHTEKGETPEMESRQHTLGFLGKAARMKKRGGKRGSKRGGKRGGKGRKSGRY